MAFTNSPLVSFTQISPNKSIRKGDKIDMVIIHCVVGQCGVEALGSRFAQPSVGASSNYGIGYDGRVGMYVEEKDRAWASGGVDKNNKPIRVNGISGADIDHRAISIECACDAYAPYKINDNVYASLIKLLADICKRNNIAELKWQGDKTLVGNVVKQNMAVHRWFAYKSCPGDYLYNLHGQIAAEVNERLEEENMVRYKTLDDIPKGYQSETKELMELGFNGKGGDAGLDVTEDMLRTMIVNLRMCKAMIAALPEQTVNKEALFAEFKKNLKLNISVE